MKLSSIPPYKPPQDLEDLLKKQALQRNRTAQVPKRNWIYRNPKKFQIVFITLSLLTFFSRPIYDAFFQPSFPEIGEALKRRRTE